MKAAFLTLGCKVNFYETEKMMEQFRRKGFTVVGFGECADVYVVNTCTVTNMADRKSRQMIHRAKKRNPDSYVVAVGCYVESGGAQVAGDSAIDAAFSNRGKETVAEQVIRNLELAGKFREKDGAAGSSHEGEHMRNERIRAYLKIQEGCNQFCTYCVIPYVRGGGVLASTPEEEVYSQVCGLAAKGYREVVLTGIHLSSYGVAGTDAHDFVQKRGEPLLSVIRRVAEVGGIERIRLGSLEPRIISEEFLEKMIKIPKICPHFHLSLQSGSDSVLRRMNRHYTTAEYREKVELLRRYFASPAVTTDIIVGFPAESEEEFGQTREFLREIQLADLHVFKYSPRSGTRAAAMGGQVDPVVKNGRSEQLIRDTEEYRRRYGEHFVGKDEKVLFEGVVAEGGEDYLAGHNERYVKIGVPLREAREKGYMENEIREVTVKKVLVKK